MFARMACSMTPIARFLRGQPVLWRATWPRWWGCEVATKQRKSGPRSPRVIKALQIMRNRVDEHGMRWGLFTEVAREAGIPVHQLHTAWKKYGDGGLGLARTRQMLAKLKSRLGDG